MDNKNRGSRGVLPDDTDNERRENLSSANDNLKDSPRDQERLLPDEALIDLPDVSDIPGQEHVQVLPLGELGDTTISSSDEEGSGLLDTDKNN